MDKLDNTKFKSHDGEVSYVTLHQDFEGEYANRSSRGYQMQVEKFRGRGAPRGGRGRGRGDYYGGYYEQSYYDESYSYRGRGRGRGRSSYYESSYDSSYDYYQT